MYFLFQFSLVIAASYFGDIGSLVAKVACIAVGSCLRSVHLLQILINLFRLLAVLKVSIFMPLLCMPSPVAQWVRAADMISEGPGFESRLGHHFSMVLPSLSDSWHYPPVVSGK